MLGELINIPTGTLIDMLFVILTGELTLTASDVAEIEQIQRELQNRGEGRFRTLIDEDIPLVADEGSASMRPLTPPLQELSETHNH